MDGRDEVSQIDVDALHRQVADDNFALRPHAMQHAVKEGFTQEDMIHVVLEGKVIEAYPGRKRCLFYADITLQGLRMPLHVVCEHRYPEEPVDFVTAYIPSEEEWETPTRRRRR
jgi:hypothetical protein